MIEDFTLGMTFEQFREDPCRRTETLRALERHAYDKVDLEIIWQTITDDLPPLKAAVLNALQSSRNRQK